MVGKRCGPRQLISVACGTSKKLGLWLWRRPEKVPCCGDGQEGTRVETEGLPVSVGYSGKCRIAYLTREGRIASNPAGGGRERDGWGAELYGKRRLEVGHVAWFCYCELKLICKQWVLGYSFCFKWIVILDFEVEVKCLKATKNKIKQNFDGSYV